MALPIFEKQADIPKGFEGEYEERDGKWHPIDHSAKLKETLDEEREKRKAADAATKKALKEADDARRAAEAAKAGVSEDQLKKAREDAAADAAKEADAANARAEAAERENRTLKLTRVVQDMFGAVGVLADKREKLFRLHETEFDLSADGKPMIKGKPEIDVTKHVAALVKGYPEWVEGTKAAGGGAAGVQKPGGGAADTADAILKDPQAGLRSAHEAGATA